MNGPLIPEQIISVAAFPPATPKKEAAYIRVGPARYAAILCKLTDLMPGARESHPGLVCVRSGSLRAALGYSPPLDAVATGTGNMVGIARDDQLGDNQIAVIGFERPVPAGVASQFQSLPEGIASPRPDRIGSPYADAGAGLSSFGLVPDPKAPAPRPPFQEQMRAMADEAIRRGAVKPPVTPGSQGRLAAGWPCYVVAHGGELLAWDVAGPPAACRAGTAVYFRDASGPAGRTHVIAATGQVIVPVGIRADAHLDRGSWRPVRPESIGPDVYDSIVADLGYDPQDFRESGWPGRGSKD